jgi:uncharacterized protein with PIN domain
MRFAADGMLDYGMLSLTEAKAAHAPRFAADRMVMRLARWLRLLGADVLSDSGLDGPAMLRRARTEGRIMLTRDKRLRTSPKVIYLRNNDLRGQLGEVLALHPFDIGPCLFTRCSRCNTLLKRVSRDTVARRIAPFVYASHETLCRCDSCGRVYWNETHPANIRTYIAKLGLNRKS